MEERNYYLRNFVPIIMGWFLLCGLFGFFFILARANFATTDKEKVFVVSWLLLVAIIQIYTFLCSGGLKLIGINFENKDSFLINRHILNNKIDPGISDKDLKDLFNALKKEPFIILKRTFIYGVIGAVFFAFIIYAYKISFLDILTILNGGLISLIVLTLFLIFFVERFFSGLLRECRKMLKEKGIYPEKEEWLSTLKSRFNYFIILLFLVVVIVVSFVSIFNLYLLAIVTLGLLISIMISKELFASVYLVFEEVKTFSTELSQKEKAEYFTGSSYKEVFNLSKDLNKSAQDIYIAREKEKKAKKELQEKLEELDKWYRFSVGRELKMVELKKEISKLKEEDQENNSD
jgi:hypothetical protein